MGELSAPAGAAPLLAVRDLTVRFGAGRDTVVAVDGASLELRAGESLGLVGESGSGKSTVLRAVCGLAPIASGSVHVDGVPLAALDARTRARRMQMVFQDPFGSLNPRMTVSEILEEPLLVHGIGDRPARRARVTELLGLVGLAGYHAERRPQEFSGGQRQRIGIARALAVQPSLIVCDEPVSALDVSIQAQVVNLLQDLQARFGLAYLFIAHDMAVVRHVADRVAVMYLGRILEVAPADRLFAASRHPYTRALLAAVPRVNAEGAASRDLQDGDVPSPMAVPSGCRFHPRCRFATERCIREEPQLVEALPGHLAACHHAAELPPLEPLCDRQVEGRGAVRVAMFARRRGQL